MCPAQCTATLKGPSTAYTYNMGIAQWFGLILMSMKPFLLEISLKNIYLKTASLSQYGNLPVHFLVAAADQVVPRCWKGCTRVSVGHLLQSEYTSLVWDFPVH